MPKLRVDIYNPHANTSPLMAGGPGAGASFFETDPLFSGGTIWGDGLFTPSYGPKADYLTGTAGNDVISGLLLNDTILGGGGDDHLGGDSGNDVLRGGMGNDTIFGHDGDDMAGGDEGNDLLIGGIGDDDLSGSNGNDNLKGDDGNDALYGQDGNDWLTGGLGDDFLDGGTGYDVADFALAADPVRIDLRIANPQYTGQGMDQLISVEFVISGSGNDTLIGSREGDTFMGTGGKDTLYGMLGNDALWGGPGSDKFVFNTRLKKNKNVDFMRDFNRKEGDKIVLDNDIFKGLKAGKLKKSAFQKSWKAKDSDDRILYHTGAKKLAYDPDGSGSKAPIVFARFEEKEALTQKDFLIIG